MGKQKLIQKPVLLENRKELTEEEFRKLFEIEFKGLIGKDFIQNENSIAYLDILINYFYKNDKFYDSDILIKNLNTPSLDKGLLIIGNPGIGKSLVLKTFFTIFEKKCVYNPLYRFRMKNSKEIILQYESKEDYINNEDFFKSFITGFLMIDDVKAEDEAFKYGKKNLLNDILYFRYENSARTIITCNYDEKYPNDIEKAIDEFGTKYDGRIYDRLFEMCNIIEAKDFKSLR